MPAAAIVPVVAVMAVVAMAVITISTAPVIAIVAIIIIAAPSMARRFIDHRWADRARRIAHDRRRIDYARRRAVNHGRGTMRGRIVSRTREGDPDRPTRLRRGRKNGSESNH